MSNENMNTTPAIDPASSISTASDPADQINTTTDPAAMSDAEKKAAEAAKKAAEKEAKKAAKATAAQKSTTAHAAPITDRTSALPVAAPLTPETLDPPVRTPADKVYYPDELADLEAEVRARYRTATPEEKPVIKRVIADIMKTKVKHTVPYIKGEGEAPLFVGFNQRRMSINRGEPVEMPYYIYQILKNSEKQDAHSEEYNRAKSKSANTGVLKSV